MLLLPNTHYHKQYTKHYMYVCLIKCLSYSTKAKNILHDLCAVVKNILTTICMKLLKNCVLAVQACDLGITLFNAQKNN